MTEIARDPAATSAVIALLRHYSFESEELTVEQLTDQWLQAYPAEWVHLALVEALYQGRYKAVSVAQILAFWQRRGQPFYRFDLDFEQLICNRLPKKLLSENQPESTTSTDIEAERPDPRVRQAESSGIVANSAKRNQTAQNSLSTQAKANSRSLSLPKIVSDLPETTHLVTSQEDQVPELPDTSSPNTTRISKLDQVLSSPITQVKVSQVDLTAADAAQTIWSAFEKYPIHQFIPEVEVSSFQAKLSAIAQRPRARVS